MPQSQLPLLRQIPSMDRLLNSPEIEPLVTSSSRVFVTGIIRGVLHSYRQEIKSNSVQFSGKQDLIRDLYFRIQRDFQHKTLPSLRRTINATGVILHTNLGRAPLSAEAVRRMKEVSLGYSNLEFDLEEGRRGKRDLHVEPLLRQILKCERSLVVNNNAAAVFLTLNSLAPGQEVLISRGELVEIGDSFRIPDILNKSGALLREVGTTNCTHLADYTQAITSQTRMILRVHPSNFRIQGFSAKPALPDLADLARKHQVLLIEDLGSGCLTDMESLGIRDEPPARSSLSAGADLICFSGDKLMGGPQAGIIAGRQDLVEQIRRNPLFRAFRLDRFRLAALEATLKAYTTCREKEEIPILQMLAWTPSQIENRARILMSLADPEQHFFEFDIVDGESMLGGGSTPEQGIPTRLLALRSSALSANDIERRLRQAALPVIGRIENGQVLLDLRTVFPDEEQSLAEVLASIRENWQRV
jgi:L-seryl-tRNA(Ser) seleniumtransferase